MSSQQYFSYRYIHYENKFTNNKSCKCCYKDVTGEGLWVEVLTVANKRGGRGNQWIGWETVWQHAINDHYNELLLISSCCKLLLVCKEPNAHLHPSLMANCVYVSSCRTNQHPEGVGVYPSME